jgi:hypothetical protein
MSKMGSHDPFGFLKHKLWPKKGWESNWQFDSQAPKVKNHPNFLACKWHATYCWKALNKSYNFASKLISIRGLCTKLWASKVMGVPILGIKGFPLGSPWTKWHLGVGPMDRHIEYYKGEGGGFLQVWAMVSLVNPCLPMARPCTKVPQLCTNQLIWFVQVHASNWFACQFF